MKIQQGSEVDYRCLIFEVRKKAAEQLCPRKMSTEQEYRRFAKRTPMLRRGAKFFEERAKRLRGVTSMDRNNMGV